MARTQSMSTSSAPGGMGFVRARPLLSHLLVVLLASCLSWPVPMAMADDSKKEGEKPRSASKTAAKFEATQPEVKKPEKSEAKKPEGKPTAAVTKTTEPAIDEKAALVFATTHHSELAELLQALKKTNKAAYVDALKDVAKEQERLAKLADRDAERHELALSLWKLDSRIRLQMAKFAMTQDSEQDRRVKDLLKERFDVRRQLLELDRKRAQTRMTKLEEQLAALGENTDERATAELERLKKNVALKAKTKK